MKLFRTFAVALVALTALCLFSLVNTRSASADGLVVIDCPTLPPPPPCPPDSKCVHPELVPGNCPTYLRVKNHNVTVSIENQVAQTNIDQTFVNDSDSVLEGTYIFPLPNDATISDFA